MTKDFDVSKHILVPQHALLSEEDASALLKKYNAKKTQLPRIHLDDPALASLGAKVGDIIRIERISKISGTTPFFRVVVE